MAKYYEQHPIAADLFPKLSPEELRELARDMVENGQIDPIIEFDGRVLDGWSRYECCLTEGLEPWIEQFDGEDPFTYVVSKNLRRRHLSVMDRKKVAMEIAKRSPWRTDRSIARAVQLSPHTVKGPAALGREEANVQNAHYEIPEPAEAVDPKSKPAEAAIEAEDVAGGSSEAEAGPAAGGRSRSGTRGEDDDQTLPSAAEADGSSAPQRREDSGRRPRGRPPGSKNTKPRDRHEQWAKAVAEWFSRDPVDAWHCVLKMAATHERRLMMMPLAQRKEDLNEISKILWVPIQIPEPAVA